MSLLILNQSEKLSDLAQRIFERQFQTDKGLDNEYDSNRKRMMLRDIIYNLECLNTSMKYDAETIFNDYARWIYRLLESRMVDIPKERVMQQMVMHYEILNQILADELPSDEAQKATHYINNAIKITKQECSNPSIVSYVELDKHTDIKKRFLQSLLNGNKQEASLVIKGAIRDGVSLKDIYVDIFQNVMYEIGNLWHQNKLTVDREHYCTAITQWVMMELYPKIFNTPRKGKTILACCVGNELHEMGIRMLCDIFELYGWDSIYIGAAVPTDGIINAIIEDKPDLVALSVTMPHHLSICNEIVNGIRSNAKTKNVKIAVGGRAFQLASHLSQKWDVDIVKDSAIDLVEWAEKEF